MSTLQSIGQGGLVGVSPTPVLQRAINKYLVNDQLLNIMQFVNNAQGNNLGNFQVSYVYYEGTSVATFRALGVPYTADNEKPLTDTVMLKFLGGAFESDIETLRAFGNNPGSVANWTEQQVGAKINSIINGFAKYFIQGDSSTDSKQFDGLNKKIVTSQVVTQPVDISNLDSAKALKVEIEVNKVISKIRPKRPNVVLTTPTGAAILRSLNAYRNRGVEVVEVNGSKYDAYMGITIVELTDECWATTDTENGNIPLVFALIDEFDGVRCSIPMDGEVIKILPPKFENGRVVEQGSVEMAIAPLFANPFAVAKCFITEKEVADE